MNKYRIFHNITLFMAGSALVGCGQESSVVEKKLDTPSATIKSFQNVLPDNFKQLALNDGGTCFLDEINDEVAGNESEPYKASSTASFVGWAVADKASGKSGAAVLVQLRGAETLYAKADFYVRPGLGNALGHENLDGSGVVLNDVSLPAKAGQYKIFFLIQSGMNMLSCDTGHSLNIE